ncbi:MAG TPA: helix-turn-helix transcriptional regulator [Alphaproteobacteria bacterium]|nr:helix-turn-helix transcriptional regulator [Alphaproteobacteria bacterium]
MPKPRPEEAPDPVDIFVGRQIRRRRLELGLSQTALGRVLGVSFQQVQKYERGDNRVAPRRLLELARLLKVPVTYFLDGALPGADASGERGRDSGLLDDPRTLQLVRYYHKIDDPELRQRVFLLIKSAGSVDWSRPKGGGTSARRGPGGRRGRGAALNK